jgi:hypothetical protein
MIRMVTVDNGVGTQYERVTPGFVIVNNKLYIDADEASGLAEAVTELVEWLKYPNPHMGDATRELISRTLQARLDRELAAAARLLLAGTDALESKMFDEAEGAEEAS